MKKNSLLLLLIPFLLSSCGGESSSVEPSSSPSPQDEYVFNESIRNALNKVVNKYNNKEVGPFDRFLLSYEGENEYRALYSDKDNNYYKEVFDMPASNKLKGQQYFYKQGEYFYSVQDYTQGRKTYKQYKYLSKNEFLYAQNEASNNPYQVCAETLKQFIEINKTSWKDVIFTKLENDNNGNIHLAIKGKQYNQDNDEYYDDGVLTIDIDNYVIHNINCSHDGNYVFDESAFDIVYPDLSSFTALNEPIKEPVDEDPLKEDEYLIDFDNNRTYYQLLVYSFADSDGDGIGDFKGIADRLDYLKDLGIEGIWLSPILKASSYHAYDIDDYYQINTAYEVTIDGVGYGINYLLKECHKRNIKVLMDLVLNHTSYNHIWRLDHADWYCNDNRFGFPELDYDKSEVREAVTDVGRYWLDRGFDGFRLDAAMWIYNSGNDRHQKNYEFWNEWCNAMKIAKPDCYLIGEVLDEDHDLAYSYANAGFDSTFDFNALGNDVDAVKNNNQNYAEKTANDIKKATNIKENYILARALSNHDIGRFNQSHPNSSDKAYYVETVEEIKLANAINALTPGNTFIYYGDELGLLGTCEDTRPNWYYDMNYRTPMPWENGRTDSVKYFMNFHGSGVTTSNTLSNQSIEEITNDDSSIYNSLKRALVLKNNNEVLQKGTVSTINNLPNGLNGFDISNKDEIIRIVFYPYLGDNIIDYQLDEEPIYTLGTMYDNGHAYISSCGLIAYSL